MPIRSRGVTSGRSWVYAPTSDILKNRWERFIAADVARRRVMFHETKRYKIGQEYPPLPGFPHPARPLADESGPCPEPVQVAYRSFDRQWVIPDNRLLAEARAGLWRTRSRHQSLHHPARRAENRDRAGLVFSGAPYPTSTTSAGGGGGVHPLWRDADGQQPNLAAGLLDYLGARLGIKVTALDFAAYLAAVGSPPRIHRHVPGGTRKTRIRVPLSADPALWRAASAIGRGGHLATHPRDPVLRPGSGEAPRRTLHHLKLWSQVRPRDRRTARTPARPARFPPRHRHTTDRQRGPPPDGATRDRLRGRRQAGPVALAERPDPTSSPQETHLRRAYDITCQAGITTSIAKS